MKSDITIISVLGTSLAYFLSKATKSKILVLNQAPKAGFHTRNTGKVHTRFYMTSKKRQSFAKRALDSKREIKKVTA